MTWQTIVDTVVVGAMGPPGGGRNHITPRLLRHFNILCFLEFDDSTLTRIFRTIVDWHFNINKVGGVVTLRCFWWLSSNQQAVCAWRKKQTKFMNGSSFCIWMSRHYLRFRRCQHASCKRYIHKLGTHFLVSRGDSLCVDQWQTSF